MLISFITHSEKYAKFRIFGLIFDFYSHMDTDKFSVERSKSVHVTLAKKDSSGRKKFRCTKCAEEVSSLCIVGCQFHWTCKPCGLYGDFCDAEKEKELKMEKLALMKRRMSLPASQLQGQLESFGKGGMSSGGGGGWSLVKSGLQGVAGINGKMGNLAVSRTNSKASSGRARRASIYEIGLSDSFASQNLEENIGKQATVERSSFGPEDDESYFGTENY